MVCAGTGCVANGALDLRDEFSRILQELSLETEVEVIPTGCNGFCGQGPIAVIQPENIFYQLLDEKKVRMIVEEHLLKGRPVERFMYVPTDSPVPIPRMSEIEFFRKQRLVVLRNRGFLDPESIEDYIARDGYKALAKALTSMTPKEVIDTVLQAGLRGRGGAGFPAAKKWNFCRLEEAEPKYVVCNADEGDPGAFMDRSIIESDPHAVIEGMMICAYSCGASEGYIYVRNEYPLAVKRLNTAIETMRDMGLLGEHIFDSEFSFDLHVVRGAGAFVCGEATALVSSIEGRVGEPRARPPRLVQYGLRGKPTNLNNVETYANVPMIILRGPEWYSSIGTEGSKGTKVFSLTGDVVNTGLVEVPMGITLREMIFDIGGGIPEERAFKAVQTGGPSGGCVPEHLLDLKVDFESLWEAGSMMGSGGMVVMDEKTCMVDVAKYFLGFTKDESCGKCVPCREGSKWMYDILNKITCGTCTPEEFEKLETLAHEVAETSLCGLGESAPNPVLTTLKYFRDEYDAHVFEGRCPAGVCRPLLTFSIDAEKCVEDGHGCGQCRRNCPEEAITGGKGTAHVINAELCDKCGICVEVCRFNAVKVA
jgi:NADH:ubiquinone oxidoreductase subunit F (NADH-binding)/(2Fe-2S) ferredoxin/Pyruvate/2-oxoacid:ferredoxin oxidoreductase delta subunit